MSRNIVLEFTAAQVRLLNEALTLLEASDEDYPEALMTRTRSKVWDAVVAMKVQR